MTMEDKIVPISQDLIRKWELADPRDRWKWTGEAPPPETVRNSDKPKAPQPYRTPQSTIDAFWYLVSIGDRERLVRWLAEHPRDAQELHKLWKNRHAHSSEA